MATWAKRGSARSWGFVSAVALGAAMLPLRSHLSIATAALVLVVPVVAGVVVGGLRAGVTSVGGRFPRLRLRLHTALLHPDGGQRPELGGARRVRGRDAAGRSGRRASGVSSLRGPEEGRRDPAPLRPVRASGQGSLSRRICWRRSSPPSEPCSRSPGSRSSCRRRVGWPSRRRPANHVARAAPPARPRVRDSGQRGTTAPVHDRLQAVALSASGRPIGLLALRGLPVSAAADRALLRTFANHAALAVERAQLREQALRSELLEEVDRLRRALLGAVSHDLRTPLATMKVASTTLLDRTISLSDADTDELHGLIDIQTDRSTRLVTSLLDMTRFQAGALELHREPWSVLDLVGETLAALRVRARGAARSRWTCPTGYRPWTSTTCSSVRCSPTCSKTPTATPRPRAPITVAAGRRGRSGRHLSHRPRSGRATRGTRGGLRQLRALRHRRPIRSRPRHRQDLRRSPRRAHLGRGCPRAEAPASCSRCPWQQPTATGS